MKFGITHTAQHLAVCLLMVTWGTTATRGDDSGPATSGSATAGNEIIVTATRDARSTMDAPYASSVLGDDVIRMEKASRTIPETLKHEPSTLIQKTAHGQGSPYIRGFTSQRNLLLIDGVRLNHSVFREGPNQYWNTVDALGLRRLEVVRGPFSVLFGSDAIGGTVNAITRGAEDLRPGSDWDRNLHYRYSDAENSHQARIESISRLSDDLVLTLGYSAKDFGELEGGRSVGTLPNTGYDEQDWDAKLEYFLPDDAVLVFAHQGVEIDDAWRTHKTIYGIDWEGLSVGKELRRVLDQDRRLTYLQYHQYDRAGPIEEVHAGLSYHQQSEDRDRLRTRGRRDRQGFDVHTGGAFLTLHSDTSAGQWIYGLEAYRDEVDSYKNTLNASGAVTQSAIQGPVGDDAEYGTVGIFVQHERPLGERVSAIVGGRYEYAEADAGRVEDPSTGAATSISDDWDDAVGSIRLLYDLNESETWRLFAGVSQGFRAPNLSDLTRLDSARTDEIETPSPDLAPEEYTSYELGVKGSTRDVAVQLTYYYTEIDGMIIRTPTGRMIDSSFEVTKRNGGDGFVQGLELGGRVRLTSELSAIGTASWMDGEVDTYPSSDAKLVTEPISRLMPASTHFGLRWERDQRYWAEATCTIAERADELSSRDMADTSRIPPGGTPGYTVYDVRAGWQASDALALSLAIENLGDEDYRVHGSGVNEPGRNVILSAQVAL